MNEPMDQAAAQLSFFCRTAFRQKTTFPIRHSEIGVLLYLDYSQEEVTPAAVSSFMGISRPCTTALLKRLEQNHYITRHPSPSDGRCSVLSLTEKGKKLAAYTHQEYSRTIRLLKDELGEERFCLFLELIKQSNVILRKNF